MIGKSTDIVVQGEIGVLYGSPDPCSSSDTRDDLNAEISAICNDTEYCESLQQVIYHRSNLHLFYLSL